MKRLLVIPAVVLLVFFTAVPSWAIPGVPPGITDPLIPGIPSVTDIIPSPVDTSCKSSPSPVHPGTNMTGLFDGASGSTIYGPVWHTYDLGCAGPAQNPGAVIDTDVEGNQLYSFAQDIVAFGNGVHHLVAPPNFLRVFDTLETNGTRALYNNFFVIFLPISIIILGLVLIFRSRQQNLPGALMMLAWALLVVSLATLAYNDPVRLGRVADQAETSMVTTVNGALGGDVKNPNAVSDLEVNNVLKPAWMQGELGATSGAVVDRWGQQLWDSQTLSWADMQGDVGKISKAKQKQFADLATQIHNADPATYDQLKGTSGGRAWAGALALVGAFLTVPFRLLADIILIASLIIIRMIVTLLPLLAPFALHDRLSGLMLGTLKIVAAAVINSIVFAAAAALNVFGVSQLLSTASGIPQWVGIFLAGLLGLMLFFATKPFRQLTKLATGYHPIHTAVHGAKRTATMGAEVGLIAVTGSSSAKSAVGIMARKNRRQAVAEKQPQEPGIQRYTRPTGPQEGTPVPTDSDSSWYEPEQLSFWKESELPESSDEEVSRARERSAEAGARDDLVEESV